MDGAATDDVPPPARDPSSGFSVRHSYPASASSSSLVYQPNDVWPPLQQQQHRRPTALSTSFDGSPSAIPLLPTTTYDRLAEGATPSGAIGRHGNADRLPQLAVVVDDDDGRVLDSSLPVSMVSQSRPAKDDARRRGDRASAATMATTPCGPPPPPPPIRSTDNSAPLAGYRSPLRAMTVRANADMSNTLPDVRCDRPLTSRTASLTSCNADQRSANDRPAAARGVTPVSGSSGVDDVGRGAATDSGVASGRQRRNVRSRTVGLPEDADDLSGGLAATAFVAGVSLVLGALAVQLLLRLTAMTTPVESEQYGGASASFGVKSQTTSFLSDDDPQVRTVVRDVAVGLAAIVVAVDLCCVLAASFQCYLVIQLTRLSNGRSR
jgi:hypothetical protein